MANIYSAFLDLLPQKNRWVGEVVSYNNGKAVIQIPQGLGGQVVDDIIVDSSASYSSGSFVFIENGIIVSQAPTLRAATREKVY